MNSAPNLIIKIFSILFLSMAILGFISDWLPGEMTFLETNTTINFIHMATAISFSSFTLLSMETSIMLIELTGIIYLIISEIGFMGLNIKMAEQWEDVFSFNLLTYLQFGLGIALCVSGLILKKRQRQRS